jgi:hypothetical protein
MNNLKFSLSFSVNSEAIEQNLKGIFVKNMGKYIVDKEIMINYKKL